MSTGRVPDKHDPRTEAEESGRPSSGGRSERRCPGEEVKDVSPALRAGNCTLLNMDAHVWLAEQEPFSHFILTDLPIGEFARDIHDCAHTYVIAGGRNLLCPGRRRIPGEKAVEYYRQMLLVFPYDTVVDPFMGTGTVGEAALLLGRNFIGIEVDPRTYQIAHERLTQWL